VYFITEREVSVNFDMKTAIDAMNDCFAEYFKGSAGADSRQRTFSDGSVLSTMPAFMNKYRITGLKTYIGTKDNARFVVLLFDTITTELLAVIEANRLGQVRTGAVTALATSILHGKISTFTLVGSGFQAETQLEGIMSISNPEEVRVYGRTKEHGRDFAGRMTERFGRKIVYFQDLRKALDGADVISCITSAHQPIIEDLSFLHSYHLNLGGSNVLSRREVSEQVVDGAQLVVVEHLEQALKESSEISDFVGKGGKAVELKEVVGSKDKFKGFKKTIFKSMGIGLEDIASAYYLLKKMDLL
jgi:alanine dehydrogenase